MKNNWKRNFRRVPEPLMRKVQGYKNKPIVVACTKAIKYAEIISGTYEHIGITWDKTKNEPDFMDRIFPDAGSGRYSLRNTDGLEIVRKDLPMTTKTFTWETPNYGDPWNGYHDVSTDREVYQREFLPPKGLEVTVELLNTQMINGEYVCIFKFVVDEVLEVQDKDFEGDLFYALNLLQENVGKCDVFPSDATKEDYAKAVIVDWEILPPGKRDEVINQILAKYSKVSPDERDRIEDRYDFLVNFKPEAFVSGTSGFQRYFGAKFRNNLVVFENLRYGNAIYIMYDDWVKLSQKNRLELLKCKEENFDRIVHSDNWKKRLENILIEKLKS